MKKSKARKTWDFIWNSNSVWSWIVDIILAFIIIKFVIFPVLGLAFATNYPVVAVVSGSMHHDADFNEWLNSTAICNNIYCTQQDFYKMYNITKQDFMNFPYRNGLNKGDIMFLHGLKPKDIKIGDIIVWKTNNKYPIIHRVIKKWEINNTYYFQTKGDHNLKSIKNPIIDETNITQNMVIGKAVLRIPKLGYIKIMFTNMIR